MTPIQISRAVGFTLIALALSPLAYQLVSFRNLVRGVVGLAVLAGVALLVAAAL